MNVKKTEMKVQQESLSEEDLELINQYTRRKYSSDELYTFSVVLCDNDVDRDYEVFTEAALDKLSELFVGKTGIYDHNPTAAGQQARIYKCYTEEVQERKNELGQPYRRLVAKAYIPVTEKNSELISAIDSGIKKEVSVGCAVKNKLCSICHEDLSNGSCSHLKGEYYNGVLCCGILDNPTDAYEWSFVAVPAQREAGVIKGYKGELQGMDDIIKRLCSGKPVCLTSDEAEKIGYKMKTLEKDAIAGREYVKELKKEVIRLCSAAEPEMKNVIAEMTEKMEINELLAFKTHFEKKNSDLYACVPQLFRSREKKSNQKNNNYNI